MKTKLSCLLFLLIPILAFSQKQTPSTPLEVVNIIKENITCPWDAKTVDTFKAGDPGSKLTGIAVCMFADMQTLKLAVQKNCNFIITHEPVFYNHLDETSAYSKNSVFEEKMKFINDHNLIIFRFHDHIHKTEPDGISEGMIQKLGLKDYAVEGENSLFRIPETTLKKYVKKLKSDMQMSSIRVIGNGDMKFTKVAFMAGAPGGQRHIQRLAGNDVDVIIAGEAPEWETYLYANDAVSLGHNKGVIFLGHIISEEAGMEYCASWLKGFIENTPIHFIKNPANFITY